MTLVTHSRTGACLDVAPETCAQPGNTCAETVENIIAIVHNPNLQKIIHRGVELSTGMPHPGAHPGNRVLACDSGPHPQSEQALLLLPILSLKLIQEKEGVGKTSDPTASGAVSAETNDRRSESRDGPVLR